MNLWTQINKEVDEEIHLFLTNIMTYRATKEQKMKEKMNLRESLKKEFRTTLKVHIDAFLTDLTETLTEEFDHFQVGLNEEIEEFIEDALLKLESRNQRISIADLHLDPLNPRLPASVQEAAESEILRYIQETGELTELARSFADNGYFVQEPILVVARDEGGYTVVEGNRRVATLKLLLEEDHNFIGCGLADERRGELEAVPAVILASADELHRYVGFRHISGLQPWSPEAKARYLFHEVRKAAAAGEDPFRAVGRRVGLRPPAVRQAFVAFAVLEHASDELGIDVQGVVDHAKRRFGVWLSAMESPDIRRFVGLGSPTSYNDVEMALGDLDAQEAQLREVIEDVGPPTGDPILTDSRKVTVYAKVLNHPAARETKRRERALDAAAEIVDREALPVRLQRIERSIEAVSTQVSDGEPPADDLIDASERVLRAARKLTGLLKQLREPSPAKWGDRLQLDGSPGPSREDEPDPKKEYAFEGLDPEKYYFVKVVNVSLEHKTYSVVGFKDAKTNFYAWGHYGFASAHRSFIPKEPERLGVGDILKVQLELTPSKVWNVSANTCSGIFIKPGAEVVSRFNSNNYGVNGFPAGPVD